MADLRKRVAYLQGLMAGLDLDTNTKEGKLWNEMISILNDMAEEVYELRTQQEEIEEYVESMDEDLYDLEDEVYDDQEEEDFDEDDWVEVDCPNCGETVLFESDILKDDENIIEVTCPNCNAVVFSSDEDYEFDDAKEADNRVIAANKAEDEDI